MKPTTSRPFFSALQIRCAPKYLICVSLLIFFGWLVLVRNLFTSSSVILGQSSDRAVFRTNVFFLKTHKTASTTTQNIFLRFGQRLSLNFLLPKTSTYLGYNAPIKDTDLDESLTPLDRKFNIFAHHSRYSENTNRYLYDDTVRVTILRYPPSQFDSLYYFSRWDLRFNLTLAELLRRPADDKKIHALTGLCNRMSFALGLKRSLMKDDERIQDFVNYIDQQFDYVMITEYMEASLVMLADFMGWPLEYVATIPLNMRVDDLHHSLSPAEESRLAALSKPDMVLYFHNLEKFRKRILQFGLTELTEGITKLRQINQNFANRCVNSTNNRRNAGKTVGYSLRDPSDMECEFATKVVLDFTKYLKEEQRDRLETIKKVHTLVSAPSLKPNEFDIPSQSK